MTPAFQSAIRRLQARRHLDAAPTEVIEPPKSI